MNPLKEILLAEPPHCQILIRHHPQKEHSQLNPLIIFRVPKKGKSGVYSMKHLRSPEAMLRRSQRQAARQLILNQSFNDALISEKVCRTEPAQIKQYLKQEFGCWEKTAIPNVFSGVVITDSRGTGAFQITTSHKTSHKKGA